MTVHVIGAGLAGLAASVRLAGSGTPVVLHEKVRAAGGRCRSFDDPRLGRRLDSGIHLAFSGYRHLHAYLEEIGAADAMTGPHSASCRFHDLRYGENWTLRPNGGKVPWWIMMPGRVVPGSGPADYLALLRLALSRPEHTVGDVIPRRGATRRRLWEPLCVAALNTAPERAQARLLWHTVREVLRAGHGSFCPRFVARDLTSDLVTPALRLLAERGANVQMRHGLIGLDAEGGRVRALHFADTTVPLGDDDAVILAVPPRAAATLVPGLPAPLAASAIASAHFILNHPAPAEPVLTGVLDGRSLWLLTRGDLATVTIGAADDLMALPAEALAQMLWAATAHALGRDPSVVPPHRVLRFRSGTFAHTPAQNAKRPPTRTHLSNMFLAGDWTRTGHPATMEGAVRSGHLAAAAIIDGRGTSGAPYALAPCVAAPARGG